MTPWLDDGDCQLYHGNALQVLANLEAGSVQTCVTSPPYWGLRDYGIQPTMWGGSEDCAHEWVSESKQGGSVYERGDKRRWQHQHNGRGERQPWIAPKGHPEVFAGDTCSRCGMWCGELGLEATPELYAEHMVTLFRAVARLLRDDGTLWLNLGDSYNAYNGNRGTSPSTLEGTDRPEARPKLPAGAGLSAPALKPKDLVGIPWRVAFALQADGWYLRSDIIWSKPNPMPESVTDRPTKAHEYLFLLSKRDRYFYDADAIREPATYYGPNGANGSREGSPHAGQMIARAARRPQRERAEQLARQHGLTDAHLAAIRASGITDTGKALVTQNGAGHNSDETTRLAAEAKDALGGYWREFLVPDGRNARSVWEIPTQPTPEAHFATYPEALVRRCILAACPAGGIVLDPFMGSGTTALVARKHGRRAIGVELNEEYLEIASRRLGQQSLLSPAIGASA